MSDHTVLLEFTKTELHQIAEELDIPTVGTTVEILTAIRKDLLDNGLPDKTDTSELMDEFLYISDEVDEDGNLLDDRPQGGETLGNVVGDVQITDEDGSHVTSITDSGDGVMEYVDHFIIDGNKMVKPPCYAYADERDPACRRCRVLEYCKEERIKTRPPCYGKLYLANNENCSVCIESPTCKIITLEAIQ